MTPTQFTSWLDGFLDGLANKTLGDQEAIKALRKIGDQLTKVNLSLEPNSFQVTYNPTTTNSTI
jgi:hypothetical protein